MPTLYINVTPRESSKLSIPPSPFSPKSPLTPPATPPHKATKPAHLHNTKPFMPTQPPPKTPLRWLWQCHQCARTYPLSVTRRCLDDGHYFCSGVTVTKPKTRKGEKRRTKTKRHRACASEFDYGGWKAYGEWRRSVQVELDLFSPYLVDSDTDMSSPDLSPNKDTEMKDAWDVSPITPVSIKPPKKNCWDHCDYPSECRWATQLAAKSTDDKVRSPISPPEDVAVAVQMSNPPTTFDDILANEHVETIDPAALEPRSPTPTATRPGMGRRKSSVNILTELTRRRRSNSSPSPTPAAAAAAVGFTVFTDLDADVDINPLAANDPDVFVEAPGRVAVVGAGATGETRRGDELADMEATLRESMRYLRESGQEDGEGMEMEGLERCLRKSTIVELDGTDRKLDDSRSQKKVAYRKKVIAKQKAASWLSCGRKHLVYG